MSVPGTIKGTIRMPKFGFFFAFRILLLHIGLVLGNMSYLWWISSHSPSSWWISFSTVMIHLETMIQPHWHIVLNHLWKKQIKSLSMENQRFLYMHSYVYSYSTNKLSHRIPCYGTFISEVDAPCPLHFSPTSNCTYTPLLCLSSY